MATARDAARSLCVTEHPVTLIYIGDGDDLLRLRVRAVARRHLGEIELIELDFATAPRELWSCGQTPTLLVMHRGELFGQAAGPLPAAEISRLVGQALRRG